MAHMTDKQHLEGVISTLLARVEPEAAQVEEMLAVIRLVSMSKGYCAQESCGNCALPQGSCGAAGQLPRPAVELAYRQILAARQGLDAAPVAPGSSGDDPAGLAL